MEWPADMPDDMLEDAINVAKQALADHDFESEGVEVSHNKGFKILVDRSRCEETHG